MSVLGDEEGKKLQKLLEELQRFTGEEDRPEVLIRGDAEYFTVIRSAVALTGLLQQRRLLAEGVRKKYHPSFPELAKLVPDALAYAVIAYTIADDKALDVHRPALLQAVSDAMPDSGGLAMGDERQRRLDALRVVDAIVAARRDSSGKELGADTLSEVFAEARGVEEASMVISFFADYVNLRIRAVAPNLTTFLGSPKAAWGAIGMLGGLKELSNATAAEVLEKAADVVKGAEAVAEGRQYAAPEGMEACFRLAADYTIAAAREDASMDGSVNDINRSSGREGHKLIVDFTERARRGMFSRIAMEMRTKKPTWDAPSVDPSIVKRLWVPRRKLLQWKSTMSKEDFQERTVGCCIRAAGTKSADYAVGVIIKWLGEGVAGVLFGYPKEPSGGSAIPMPKVSNSSPQADEIAPGLLQLPFIHEAAAQLQKESGEEPAPDRTRTRERGDDGEGGSPKRRRGKEAKDSEEDWVPEDYASQHRVRARVLPPGQNAQSAAQKPAVMPYPTGMLVEATGLKAMPLLNGRRGRVKGVQGDRITVDFPEPFGEKALKPVNLIPVPPEEDPLNKPKAHPVTPVKASPPPPPPPPPP
eukprot:Hpha_TRINITY_DN4105_c0_g1::TRINITY_DN4105_c0_g1_i1::g.194654::m.194654